jgi:hypothetical protein
MLAALMAPVSVGAVTPVHKCTVNGAVTYQSDPCPSGEARKQPTPEQLTAEPQKGQRQAAEVGGAQSTPGMGGQGAANPATASGFPAQGKAERPTSTAAPTESRNPFKCDGRKYCSQMTSCAEARYFLANCPGAKMDGDGNGIPCERQWCNR